MHRREAGGGVTKRRNEHFTRLLKLNFIHLTQHIIRCGEDELMRLGASNASDH